MKIIFLDIDGVMNNKASFRKQKRFDPIDPCAVKLLNKLTDETGAKIVISSTWRLGRQETFNRLIKRLKEEGITGKIIGRTPDLENEPRGHEIIKWINECKNYIETYVIFDDDTDIQPVKSHWIQTSFIKGLRKNHICKAIKMLGGINETRYKQY